MDNNLKIKELKEDPYETIIEKTGLTSEFTLATVVDHLDHCKKRLMEATAQLKVHENQDELAIKILPILKDIPLDQVEMVRAYCDRQISNPAIKDLMTTCEETIKNYQESLPEIYKLVGVEIPVESPMQKVGGEVIDITEQK